MSLAVSGLLVFAGGSDTTAPVREESEDQQQPEYKVSADTATVCTGKLDVLNLVLQPHLTIKTSNC